MMLTIHRDGLPFRLAYFFRHESTRPAADQIGNLCPFFWRLVGMSILILLWLVYLPIGFVVLFLFAERPRIYPLDGRQSPDAWDLSKKDFLPYEHWPTLGRGGPRILPITVLLIGTAIWGVVELCALFLWIRFLVLCILLIAVIAIALMVADVTLEDRGKYFWILGDQEKRPARPAVKKGPGFVRLGWEFVKAKAKGLCPAIKFV